MESRPDETKNEDPLAFRLKPDEELRRQAIADAWPDAVRARRAMPKPLPWTAPFVSARDLGLDVEPGFDPADLSF